MKTQIQKLPKSQVEISFELSAQEFEEFFEQAVLKLSEKLTAEGFRPGRLPKEMAEARLDPVELAREAAEQAVKKSYEKVILENNLEPLGSPEIEILKLARGNPLEFKVRFFVLPEVKLPAYKQIASRSRKRKVFVEEKEIEQALSWLHKNYFKDQGQEEFPEPNDEFARKLGRFENLKELKESLRQGIKAEKELAEQQRLRQEMLERISEKSQADIPENLVELEKRRMLEDLKRQVEGLLNVSFEDYLRKISKNEKELVLSFQPEAEKRVKRSLVLREIEKQEKIEVSEKEVEDEVNKTLSRYPDIKTAEEKLDLERFKEYTREMIRNEKAFRLLEEQISQ
jgi:FKBP-type peptidyl-prolyl cis-trans isomerase (trigger factor)